MDLFGPIDIISLRGNKYVSVIVDDYSRYIWTYFLSHRSDYFKCFTKFYKQVQNEKGFMISFIHIDHGGEFKNHDIQEFYDSNVYDHNFSTPRNP